MFTCVYVCSLVYFLLFLPSLFLLMSSAPPASSVGDGDGGDPQLYLDELTLQDCTCSGRPTRLPHWRKWSSKTAAGKKKIQPTPRGGHSRYTHAHTHSRDSTPPCKSRRSLLTPAPPVRACCSVWIPFGFNPSLGSILIFGGSDRTARTFADLWKFDLGT